MTRFARSGRALSIGQTMMVILIVALCMAPLILAAKTQEGGRILGAVVFDIVVLPTVASLVVAAVMAPGVARDWYIKAFWLTPLVFLGASLTLAVPYIILGALWNTL